MGLLLSQTYLLFHSNSIKSHNSSMTEKGKISDLGLHVNQIKPNFFMSIKLPTFP